MLQKEYVLFEQVQRYCYICDDASVYREMMAEGSFEENSILKQLLQSTITQRSITFSLLLLLHITFKYNIATVTE